MPTEFRFDDLDLREEAESSKSREVDGSSQTCTGSDYCTQTCTTSHNTCTTFFC